MKKLRKRHSGEGYIDVCVLVVCAMLVLALAVRILPVFVAKQQLDTYAVELVREAEISGRVGTETSRVPQHSPTAPDLIPTSAGRKRDAFSSMRKSP